MKRLAIIGSGVVGSATGKGFLAKGHRVVFYDVRSGVVENLVRQGLDARYMDALDVNGSDAFFFSVSTPTIGGEIDLDYLYSAVRDLGRKLKKRRGYCVVVIRSTVPPRTLEDTLIPFLEKGSGKRAGPGFGVAMNPEYLREKNAEDDFLNPWVITVGALDRRSAKFMDEVFADFPVKPRHLSLREAEMQKYVHNLYNAVKIAFFNEMRVVADRIDIDPDEIFAITTKSAEAFWNKKYGTKNMGPFSGSCLPKDTQAFFRWSQGLGLHLDVLGGAIDANRKFIDFWDRSKGNGRGRRNPLGVTVSITPRKHTIHRYVPIDERH